MWMVVGLGNAGAKYQHNRHNIGFHVVDELARKHGLPAWKTGKQLGGDTSSGSIDKTKTILLKPMELMNLSGFAVQRTAGFHDVAVENIVVVHDEIDLEFGIVRLKSGGGHGGHNGLRSIIDQLGGNGFSRIRMGVGKGPPGAPVGRSNPLGDKDVAGWVLSDFPSAQRPVVDKMIAAAVEAVESIFASGITKAMNQLNGRPSLAA
jgi:PTH1 family peptidyl-tRNA hydrolase